MHGKWKMKCFFLCFAHAFVYVLIFDQVHIVFFYESIRMIRMKYCFDVFIRVPQQSIDCCIQFSYCCSACLGIISEYLLLCTMHSIPQSIFGSILLNTRVLLHFFQPQTQMQNECKLHSDGDKCTHNLYT